MEHTRKASRLHFAERHLAGDLIDVPNPTLGVAFFSCHLLYPLLLRLPIPVLGPLIPQLFYVASAPGRSRDEVRSVP